MVLLCQQQVGTVVAVVVLLILYTKIHTSSFSFFFCSYFFSFPLFSSLVLISLQPPLCFCFFHIFFLFFTFLCSPLFLYLFYFFCFSILPISHPLFLSFFPFQNPPPSPPGKGVFIGSGGVGAALPLSSHGNGLG